MYAAIAFSQQGCLGASLLSLVGLCLANFGIYERLGITSEVWQTLTTALLATLTAFGVLNNPTDGENF